MPMKFFVIPARESLLGEAELNQFLESHRVLLTDRHFVSDGRNYYWAVCVDYHVGAAPSGSANGRKPKIDYREVLSSEQFARFAKLRELRQKLAQEESIPVYTIFTNEQLAAMITRDVQSPTDLQGIEGVGESRVSKYGLPQLRWSSGTWEPA
jgi:superfamily II DNA helicase RecQ